MRIVISNPHPTALSPEESAPNPGEPQPKQPQFAHIPTPVIPHGADDFLLYIILDLSASGTSSATGKTIQINTLTTPFFSDTKVTDFSFSPKKLNLTFAALPAEMRDAWNAFVAELQARPELSKTAIVVKSLSVQNKRLFVRVFGVERSA